MEEKVPIGSVPIYCPNCLDKKGWDIYEAVTDVGRPTERYYAVCLNCGKVLPLQFKEK